MTILIDTSLGRTDFDKGYPKPEKIHFHVTQNFDLELQQIKRKIQPENDFYQHEQNRQQRNIQNEQPKEIHKQNFVEKPKEIPQQQQQTTTQPSKTGRRVVRKQVPMPTK